MKLLLPMVLSVVVLTGCGTGGEVESTETADEFAQGVKTQIADFVEKAQNNAKTAASDLEIMMESLTAYADEKGEGFVELRDAAQALLDSYKSGAAKDEIKTKLDALKAKADAL